jgi:hypothetical protein
MTALYIFAAIAAIVAAVFGFKYFKGKSASSSEPASPVVDYTPVAPTPVVAQPVAQPDPVVTAPAPAPVVTGNSNPTLDAYIGTSNVSGTAIAPVASAIGPVSGPRRSGRPLRDGPQPRRRPLPLQARRAEDLHHAGDGGQGLHPDHGQHLQPRDRDGHARCEHLHVQRRGSGRGLTCTSSPPATASPPWS